MKWVWRQVAIIGIRYRHMRDQQLQRSWRRYEERAWKKAHR